MTDLPAVSPELHFPTAETSQQRHELTTVFQTYVACLGNAQRTAAALMLSVDFVEMAAKRESWDDKVKALLALRKESGAEALAREINRVANVVQAVRLRNLIDRVIRRITDSEQCFEDFVSNRSAKSDNVTMRNLADLAKACETTHRLTYNALGDSLTERIDRDEDAGVNATSMAVLKALSIVSPDDATAGARKLLLPNV